PLIFSVNSLLSSKMGISDFLEQKEVRYSAYLRAMVTGTVKHPSHSESTAMLNVVVLVEKGAQHFPPKTASYSHILWSSVDSFLETARSKDPLLLDLNLDPIEYCIH